MRQCKLRKVEPRLGLLFELICAGDVELADTLAEGQELSEELDKYAKLWKSRRSYALFRKYVMLRMTDLSITRREIEHRYNCLKYNRVRFYIDNYVAARSRV